MKAADIHYDGAPMDTASPAARLHAWLRALPPAQLDALGRRYARAAAEGGATILKPGGQVLPIPPLLTPEVLDAEQIADMEENAHALLAGLSRLTAWLMQSARGETLRHRLFPAFGVLEAEALAQTWREAERLATARVDYLVDAGGIPRAFQFGLGGRHIRCASGNLRQSGFGTAQGLAGLRLKPQQIGAAGFARRFRACGGSGAFKVQTGGIGGGAGLYSGFTRGRVIGFQSALGA